MQQARATLMQREPNAESRAATRLALHIDATGMFADDSLHNHQAES
jgi:hypothetical protein